MKYQKIKKFLISIIIIFLAIWLAFTLHNQRKMKVELEEKKAAYEKEIAEIQKDVDYLKLEIENSDSLEFVERVAREELGMVKPREIVVIDKSRAEEETYNFNDKVGDE